MTGSVDPQLTSHTSLHCWEDQLRPAFNSILVSTACWFGDGPAGVLRSGCSSFSDTFDTNKTFVCVDITAQKWF